MISRGDVADLAELNRLFATWVETCNHRAVHWGQAGGWGSVPPAFWSFMLPAREHGLVLNARRVQTEVIGTDSVDVSRHQG